VSDAPCDFLCRVGSRGGFYTALDGGLMRCFVGVLVMSTICIGVTRGDRSFSLVVLEV